MCWVQESPRRRLRHSGKAGSMDTTEFADHVAEVVVEEGKLDQSPVIWKSDRVEERPYLPLRTLEQWSQSLGVFGERIKDDNARIALYLLDAANYVQMAVWEYERKYGTHANGPAPTNVEEK